jgi:hypothetical protein
MFCFNWAAKFIQRTSVRTTGPLWFLWSTKARDSLWIPSFRILYLFFTHYSILCIQDLWTGPVKLPLLLLLFNRNTATPVISALFLFTRTQRRCKRYFHSNGYHLLVSKRCRIIPKLAVWAAVEQLFSLRLLSAGIAFCDRGRLAASAATFF